MAVEQEGYCTAYAHKKKGAYRNGFYSHAAVLRDFCKVAQDMTAFLHVIRHPSNVIEQAEAEKDIPAQSEETKDKTDAALCYAMPIPMKSAQDKEAGY